jgi:hypothetical protein
LDFQHLSVFNGDDVDPPEVIAPEKMSLLKYAHETSCDAERAFPAYKTHSIT